MMNTSKLMGAFFALLLFGCLCAPAAAARGVVTTELRNPIRSGPSAEYARITVLPAGVKLWATDKEGQWYRIRLSSVLEAWTHEGNVDVLDSGQSVDTARLTDMSVTPQDRNHRVIFYLSRPVPFRIRQSVVPPQLRVDLFNCSAAQEMIRHFPGSQSIRISPAQQLANGWVEIAIDLPNTHQTGYQARFSSSGHLLLDINKSFRSADLAGKRIAIDPGHGGSDTGAVGPTGLTEKEVNLTISSLLRERLETAGAEVVLTRYTDTAVAPGSGKSGELEARVQTTKVTLPSMQIPCRHATNHCW
ncbi:MAG: N-acetylmuramoyl-L-alanine amidase [Armatimonadota bacterium]